MIKEFSNNFNVKLSEHFTSKEFICKCGKCQTSKIDTDLIDMLENLITYLGASKCIVSSGYRCDSYDIKIGGFKGKHSQGMASDCVFLKDDDIYIPSYYVLCACQELFNEGGFANISDKLRYVHIDSRKGSIYKGDERKGNNSVTTDFFKYFNVDKNDFKKLFSQLNNKKSDVPFKVRVNIDDLNIRKQPSINSNKVVYNGNTHIPKGIYTIVETSKNDGYTFGKLKSGIGWISLEYCEVVNNDV